MSRVKIWVDADFRQKLKIKAAEKGLSMLALTKRLAKTSDLEPNHKIDKIFKGLI